jgi:hypothetical protein
MITGYGKTSPLARPGTWLGQIITGLVSFGSIEYPDLRRKVVQEIQRCRQVGLPDPEMPIHPNEIDQFLHR